MKKKPKLSEEEVDDLVVAQAEDDSAWGRAVHVRKRKLASVTIPAELAARAAFLARAHREKHVERWLARIIRERVELEEVAFSAAKRDLGARRGA
jgi:hypothetical protein